MDFSWNNLSQTATGYEIQRKPAGGSWSTIGTVDYADTTYYSDTTPALATQYYYQVLATDGDGNYSAASNVVTGVTGSSIGTGGITVTASADEGSAVTLDTPDTYASGEVDPVAGWTVDWGDGTTPAIYTSDPGSFTYTYDTPGVYTITATSADGSVSGTASTTIGYVGGSLSLTDNTDETYLTGLDYEVTAAFTDPAGHHVDNYVVDWGDGNIQPFPITDPGTAGDTQTFDHTYAIGSGYEYCVTVDAETDEGFYPANTYVFTASSYTDPTNTISVETTTPDTGYNFALVFEDGGTGTSSESYTIDWGDGTDTSASAVPNESSATIDHNYANSGVYNITVTGDDSGDVGSYQSNFAVAPPTLTSAGEQVTGPGQSVTLASFTGLTDADANAEVDWGDGTGPHPGNILEDGTITADAPATPGVYTPTITLYQPDADAGPGFVEYGGGLTSSVGVDTTVDVWGIVINGGQNNDLLIASSDGTQNLQPVTVYFPHPAGEALDLTLTSSDDTEDDVWNTASPTSGATPLLGNGVASTSFTVGPTDSMEQTLWVGATQGDTTANVFSLSLSGSADSGASTSTFDSEVSSGSLGATGATGATGPTSEASDAGLTIELESDPNDPGSFGEQNVTDNSTHPMNWLVGQYTDLLAEWIAPPSGERPLTYEWNIPGNVLKSYTENPERAATTSIYSGFGNPGGIGNLPAEIKFFWVSVPGQSATETVSLTAMNFGSLNVVSHTVYSTFKVYEPSTTFGVAAPLGKTIVTGGPPGEKIIGGYTLVTGGGEPTSIELVSVGAPLGPGIKLNGNVSVPSAFSPDGGQWKFVQLVTPVYVSAELNSSLTPPSSEIWKWDINGKTVLDTFDPYPAITPNGTGSGGLYTLGETGTFSDSPTSQMPLGTGHVVQSQLLLYLFQTYVMFLPPGNGSSWVPTQQLDWHWFYLTAQNRASGYDLLTASGPLPLGPWVATEEPTWTKNYKDHQRILVKS